LCIWKTLDRDTGQRVAWEGGRRDAAPLKRVVARLAPWDVTCSCTDMWATSAALIPPDTLGQHKATTHAIARNPCRQHHWCGRFQRQSIMVSHATEMVYVTMALCARCRVHGDIAAIFTLDRMMEATRSPTRGDVTLARPRKT